VARGGLRLLPLARCETLQELRFLPDLPSFPSSCFYNLFAGFLAGFFVPGYTPVLLA
jgi:hypothetical protein